MVPSAPVPPPSDRPTARLRDLPDRFRGSRERGSAPDPGDFLPSPADPLRGQALEGLVRIDLEFRLRLGEAPSLEDYLARFPELAHPPERLARLLAVEYQLRLEHGDDPLLDSYRGRFPGEFEAMRAMLGDQPPRERFLPSPPEAEFAPPPTRDLPADLRSPPGRPLSVPSSPELLPPVPADGAEPSIIVTPLHPAARRPEPPEVPTSQRPTNPMDRFGGSGDFDLPSPPPPPAPGPSVLTPRTPGVTPADAGVQIRNGYRLLNKIGSGGFGEVWKAVAPGGIEVAVKRIVRAVGGRELELEERALELIKGLRHPYLVQTQAFWREGDELYIAMEMCDLNLRQRLKRAKDAGQPTLPVEEILTWLGESAEALDYLHAQSVQHRDIKPDNILLTRGHVKVADFGLAREFTRLDPGGLMSATMGGTYIYMAPEVFDGRLSEHSDQFSLAMTFAELRLGRRVCRDQGLMEIMRYMQGGQFDLNPLPPAEQSVLRRALAREPSERFASCTAFAAAWKEACKPAGSARSGGRGRSGGVAPNSRLFPPDTTEGGYRLIELIGRGGFGEVWRSEAPGGVEVAVKRIFQPVETDGQEQQELDALELTKRLRHPYLVQTQAFWRDGDRLFIVMELCDGSLRQRLKAALEAGEQGLAAEEMLDYFREAAEAIDFLNDQGVQHRDVKPDNMLLQEGHVKLADFGLAKALTIDDGLATVSFAGTVKYSPPESFDNQLHRNSDQFSLAMAYVELRRGRPLVETSNRFQAMRYIHDGKYELSGMPEAEVKVLARALARDPAERYPSCTAFVTELDKVVRPRRRGWVVTAAACLVAAAAAVAAAVAWQGRSPVLPEHCEKVDEEWVEDRTGVRYYKRVRLGVGEAKVLCLVVPQGPARPGRPDVQTFYMMQDKVTRGQFARWGDRDDLTDRAKAWKNSPAGVKSRPDDWPVTGVNVFDAQRFAREEYAPNAGLPTDEQWDTAAGTFEEPRKAVGPYTNEWTGPRSLNIRVGFPLPAPVGTSIDDVAQPYGFRDMAGNGYEWTRCLVGTNPSREKLIPEQPPRGFASEPVALRGWSYQSSRPLAYKDYEVKGEDTVTSKWWDEVSDEIGFRIAFVPQVGAAP